MSVAAIANVGGIDQPGLLIGAPYASPSWQTYAGLAHLIPYADLAVLDAADGSTDGIVALENVGATHGGYSIEGPSTEAYAGVSVAATGDLDGDGQEEILIGAEGAIGAGDNYGLSPGEAHLLLSSQLDALDASDYSTDGIISLGNTDGNGGYVLSGWSSFGSAGGAVSDAGDFDGDGIPDLAIGARMSNFSWSGTDPEGQAFLVSGARLGALDEADGNTDGIIDLDRVGNGMGYTFTGANSLDYAGISVGYAGDVDGDARADLLIGAMGADLNGNLSGATYLVHAADLARLDAADGVTDEQIDLGNVGTRGGNVLQGATADDRSGLSVSTAGDLDGDDLSDFMVSSYTASGPDFDSYRIGNAYLLLATDLVEMDAADGSTDGFIDLSNMVFTPGDPGEPEPPEPEPQPGARAAFGYRFVGAEAGDATGVSAAIIGDIDGDGTPDLLIGSAGAASDAGQAYLLRSADLRRLDRADGTRDGVIDLGHVGRSRGGYVLTGVSAGDDAGGSVASAGDIDGDGTDDILIGSAGEAHLILTGTLDDLDLADGVTDGVIGLQSANYTFVAEAGYDSLGQVASAGDADNDDTTDILIGATGSASGAGIVYLLYGADLDALDRADNVTDGRIQLGNVGSEGGYAITGAALDDGATAALAAAGDIDNDERDDLPLGAAGPAGSANQSGMSFLLHAADLAGVDGADGSTDGRIDLANVGAAHGGYAFVAPGAGDRAGTSVAVLGDADGDGVTDYLIGAPGADTANAGAAYFVSGAQLAALDAADGSTDGAIELGRTVDHGGYVLSGAAAGHQTGTTVAAAGDADGDGHADLLIGATGANADAGLTYLVSGRWLADLDAADGTADGMIGLDGAAATRGSFAMAGVVAGDSAGASLHGAADLDGDGRDDLLIGAPGADAGGADAGEVYMMRAADLIPADAADGNIDGNISLEHTPAPPPPAARSYRFDGIGQYDDSGARLVSIGDLDGDDWTDFVIASPEGDSNGALTGDLYVIHAAELVSLDAADGVKDGVIFLGNVGAEHGGYVLMGEDSIEKVGYDLAALKDFDGDGLADLLIGANNGGGPVGRVGKSYLVSGGRLDDLDAADGTIDGRVLLSNTTDNGGYTFNGIGPDHYVGQGAADVGDVDDDNLSDFLIGYLWITNGNQDPDSLRGGAYLIRAADLSDLDAADGATDGVIALADVGSTHGGYAFRGAAQGDQAGVTVSSAGDVDGDGHEDMLISAVLADTGGSNSGEAYLIRAADLVALDEADGNTDGLIELSNVGLHGGYRLVGEKWGDYAGSDLAGVGDVDGDGRDDLVIGATKHGPGVAYMISGTELDALDIADGTTDGTIDLGNVGTHGGYYFRGDFLEDHAGATIASAGDVDGDGRPDLMIGATRADGNGADSGEVYVIPAADLVGLDAADGTADGIVDLGLVGTGHGGRVFFGAETGDGAGSAAVAVGDLDGDGLEDLLIGASNARGTIDTSGVTYLVRSSEFGADGRFDLGDIPICFVRGTRILTDRGEIPVETIRPGDQVMTLDEGWQPVRWVGRTARLAYGRMAPVRIAAGALCNRRDLWVSPQHRMLIRLANGAEAFAPAIRLVNGGSIRQVAGGTVEYFHVLCARHQVLLAEGAPAESFFPGPEAWKTLPPEARAELRDLFPGLAPASAVKSRSRPGPGSVPGFGPLARPVAALGRRNPALIAPVQPVPAGRGTGTGDGGTGAMGYRVCRRC